MIHFGVIHATFRDPHTMPRTVASLYEAGVEQVTIFPDNGTLGAMRNLDKALRHLVGVAAPGDHVCVCDDDMVVCKDALLKVNELIVGGGDHETVATLWTVPHNVRHVQEGWQGWTPVDASWDIWGGMVVMPRDVARKVIDHTFWKRYRQTHKEGKHCDAALYATLGYLDHQVWHHFPSLADDISEGSTTIGTTNKHELRGVRFEEWQEPTR